MKLYLATDDALAILTLNDDRCQCDLQLTNQRSQCVATDPLRPELVYCGTFGNGLWLSHDTGKNWQQAERGITHSKILSVAVSQTERINGLGAVYAGTEPSAVFRSEDGGVTWTNCNGLLDLPSAAQWSFPPRPETHHVRWIHPDPHVAGQLFVAIEAGALVRSPDRGATWKDRVPTGPIDSHQLATHDSVPGRFYSAAGDGYFESHDGGEIWLQLEDGLAHRYVWSVAVDPTDPETRIISSATSPAHSHNKESAESHLYRRTAQTEWQRITNGLPAPSGRRTALVVAHPEQSGVFFAVWEQDLFRSTDGGNNWQQLNPRWPESFDVGEPRGLIVAPAGGH